LHSEDTRVSILFVKAAFKYTLLYILALVSTFLVLQFLTWAYGFLVPLGTGWIKSDDSWTFSLLFSSLFSFLILLIWIIRSEPAPYSSYVMLMLFLFLTLAAGYLVNSQLPPQNKNSEYPFPSQRLVVSDPQTRIFVREQRGQTLRNLVLWDETGAAVFGSGVWDPQRQRVLIVGSQKTYPLERVTPESMHFAPKDGWGSLVADVSYLASLLVEWGKNQPQVLLFYALIWTLLWGSLLICLSFKSWPLARWVLLLLGARLFIFILRYYHYDLPIILAEIPWMEGWRELFPPLFLGSLMGFTYSLQALFKPFGAPKTKKVING